MSVLHERLERYVREREAELRRRGDDQLDGDELERLEPLVAYLRERRVAGTDPARLVFVCTHNSRRSQMAQLWATLAAQRYGLDVEAFSGGTEITAFEPRAVLALRRAGWDLRTEAGNNPVVHARCGPDAEPVQGCSKRVEDEPNPMRDFAAVLVCTDADRACPRVEGADARFLLPFEDPGRADDTPEEAVTYDARCAEIGRAMLHVMARAANPPAEFPRRSG